ncbi:MAG: DNA polymerase III subunit beta [Erysipelotrichales bacterium]|nr:DNA polymerase III subunit beta [Erysipelotrichales bacterium]
MKFSIKKNIILEQLTNVSKAISTRNIIPILNGIKFELSKDGLSLTASDSDLTIKSFIPKDKIEKIEIEGEIIIQSKYILEIIKKMPSDVINFEVIDGLKILIYTETSQYNLNCLNSLDYPQIDLKDNEHFIELKSGDLKKMIRQTIFAVSTQESRPLLTGINIKVNGNLLECTATDSYRLAKKTINLTDVYEDVVDIVIPGKNINELDKIMSEENKNVEIHIFDNKIMFKYENIIFQSNLLNGTYPNTANFIPAEFEHIISVKLNDYFNAIDGASLLTQSKEKNIVKMDANNNELIITSYASEIGKAENRITVDRNIMDDISISFSAKYMMDALRTIDDEDIIICMNSDSKPIVIKSVSDESLIQLVLPIKTY